MAPLFFKLATGGGDGATMVAHPLELVGVGAGGMAGAEAKTRWYR